MWHPADFYTYMHYPLPDPIDFFASDKKHIEHTTITRKHRNPHTERLITKVNKYHRLYKSIPFIKAIYLCDGISFNASTQHSDIDLFFVVEEGHIRRARFISVLLFWILGIKRSFSHKADKFDLIMYVTQSHTDLQPISLPYDPYLYHWLAHLIPIYTQEENYSIYQQNTWLYKIFPNLPYDKHIVSIGILVEHGSTIAKKIGEYVLWRNFRELIISTVRYKIIQRKTSRRKHTAQDLIMTPYMLKFHKDIRTSIAENIRKQ